ncbi:MAG TPA: hypothetical protein HA298_02985 [Methanobacteriales archaeon]|nr:hypothetical protein [Methanobacteriaceae archaeon]HIH61639.1 hypothetical protein [Methanobacteriales archaeon]
MRKNIFFLTLLLCFFLIGGVSAAGQDNLTVVATGSADQQPDHVIISINQTRGWIIPGPTGSPPSTIDIQVPHEDMKWISIYFRDAETAEHFEDDTGACEQIGLIVNGQTMGKWSFYDPWLFEGFREGWGGDHETWRSYYDPTFKITIKCKPSTGKGPFYLFSKDVKIHYKNLQAADGNAGFEEIITLCIADPENLQLDPIRANWEAWKLNDMTSWEAAAYGTFLTAFKTLYMWQDSLPILAQNLSIGYQKNYPLFMICGVTQLGFIGGSGYTYMHTPFITIDTSGDYFWDMKDSNNYRDFDKRVKVFNIARGLLLKKLETIILKKIGVNASDPVERILEAVENGNAIITHDPVFIEWLSIGTPNEQTGMFIDLACNGQTIVAEYTPIGWLYGTIGTGGACYHKDITQHTQQIKIKDWLQYIYGVLLVSCSTYMFISAILAAPETDGISLVGAVIAMNGIIDGLKMMEESVEVE